MNWYGIEPNISKGDVFIKNGVKHKVIDTRDSLYDPMLIYVQDEDTGEIDRFESLSYKNKGYRLINK